MWIVTRQYVKQLIIIDFNFAMSEKQSPTIMYVFGYLLFNWRGYNGVQHPTSHLSFCAASRLTLAVLPCLQLPINHFTLLPTSHYEFFHLSFFPTSRRPDAMPPPLSLGLESIGP